MPIAKALQLTGVKRAFVVHGSGLDEIALHGDTQIIEIDHNQLIERTIKPADFGLNNYSLEEIKGGTPAENATVIKDILSGTGKEAHNAAVIINCAALLYLHDKADSLIKAAQLAAEVLTSGKGLTTLSALVELSNASYPSSNTNASIDIDAKADK